ncbi:uncharacterized protein [Nicotiana tomentosiformis]|uniref:uncharacterized protein n=1 Tax=Nicotiana tomentosiformis TaxID=4098 RepID=UPI00388C3B38
MDIPKQERILALRITEGSDLEDDEMAMITKNFKKYLRRRKGSSRSGQYIKSKAPEKQTKRSNESSDDDDDDDDDEDDDVERALISIEESDEETEEQLSKECVILKAKCKNLELRASETVSDNTVLKNQVHTLDTTVLDLRSGNLKLKLGIGKKTVDHTQLTLEENIGNMKDELSSDALLWLQEHHRSDRKGLGFGNLAPKWDPKSKYLTIPENTIFTHCGNTGLYKSEGTSKEKEAKTSFFHLRTLKEVMSSLEMRIKVRSLGLERDNMVAFTSTKCFVINLTTDKIVLHGKRENNIYVMDLSTLSDNELICLSVLDNNPLLWHKRLGHASLCQLNKLVSKDLVIGMPNIKFKEDKVCEACARGKQVRSSFKNNKTVSTNRTMELVHMDLCGPLRRLSRGGKRYVMVLVDDYSRITWTLILTSKDESFDIFTSFVRKIQKQLGNQLVSIRSDHGTEFENAKFVEFCDKHGINHNFYAPTIPQQNGECPDYVYKLENALYGHKQAPRLWYKRLSKFLLEHGYKRGKIDNTLLLKEKGKDLLVVQIYVDDIIFGVTTDKLSKEFAKLMSSEFEMSMMATATKLDIDEPGSFGDQTMYRGMIDSLLYLTYIRPDIVFSVGLYAGFQTNPKESHLTAVKRILRYLKGTTNLCLWYPKDFLVDRKSTSGMAYFLGSCLVSWANKKQNSVSLSTAEDECKIQTYTRDFSVKNPIHQDYMVTSGPKITSEIISEVVENLENRFVLVGTITGVETTKYGKPSDKNRKKKEKESESAHGDVRGMGKEVSESLPTYVGLTEKTGAMILWSEESAG